MHIHIQEHYLFDPDAHQKVPQDDILDYFHQTTSIRLDFRDEKLHVGDDFFENGADLCASLQKYASPPRSSASEPPVIDLYISGAEPNLLGAWPDGALLTKSRSAIAVFLGSANFKDLYKPIFDTFYLQVCVHEIGHALTLLHGSDFGVKHIMLQSSDRGVSAFDRSWGAVSYRQPIGKNGPIPCHPFTKKDRAKLLQPNIAEMAPVNGDDFKDETPCQH